ncbi:MAG: hypothetical protein M0Q51_15695 [Bacteroidales bacterium]|nr:hypothetical protein [Bacteroidales bacterium]
MSDLDALQNLVLAPYILKATALISVSRIVGGNQFRHSFSTLGILPMARQLNADMVIELTDLIARRRDILRRMNWSREKENLD